jgi:hypothetical protein
MSPIISSVDLVIPKTGLLIFGQNGSIDRLAHQIILRQILRAEGSNIGDDMWGERSFLRNNWIWKANLSVIRWTYVNVTTLTSVMQCS